MAALFILEAREGRTLHYALAFAADLGSSEAVGARPGARQTTAADDLRFGRSLAEANSYEWTSESLEYLKSLEACGYRICATRLQSAGILCGS